MKHISDLVDVSNLSVAREEKKNHATLDPTSVKLVEYVFAKFYVLCRGADALFADENRVKAEKTQWYSSFTREKFTTVEHIKKALLKLERHRYPNPPQLGEFLSWNEKTPEDLNLLSKEQAFNRVFDYLREGKLKDLSADQNFLFELSVKECGSFFLQNNSMNKTQPVFYRNYEIILRNFLQGKIQPIPKAIEDNTEQTKEIAKQQEVKKGFDHLIGYEQCMPEIRKILGMNADGTTNTPVKRR